ncbi:MAG TPA: hypothetical protein VFQ77_21895 [Pseudonocardiaceae bacterium]|jgi:hypothetical protein|nr:hypothetical protein [Pseudonocardiaceae bacterium]
MTALLPEDDDQLLRELGAALHSARPITNDDLGRARAAFTWRTVDEELALATLVYDSSVAERPLVRSASLPGSRTLVFEADTVAVEVDATPDALVGRVVPAGRADISLLTLDGPVSATTADDMGSFVLPTAPPGPVRLRCQTATAHLVTDWVRL